MAPTCPICGKPVAEVRRNAEPTVTEAWSGLFGAPPGEVKVKNPDRTGVVTHDDGTACLVGNVEPLLKP